VHLETPQAEPYTRPLRNSPGRASPWAMPSTGADVVEQQIRFEVLSELFNGESSLGNSGQLVASLNTFDRIAFAQNIMGGRACVRRMRINVSLLVNLIANEEFHPFAPTAA
jgi:hypothetical protein